MRKIITLAVLFTVSSFTYAQQTDSAVIRSIYDYTLTQSDCYKNLDYLCNKIGGRLSGSENAEKAVQYTKSVMENYDFDKVYLQEVMVPHWVRGEKEEGYFINKKTKTPVRICALGGSIATPKSGIQAQIIEVKDLDELKKLSKEKVKGKILFLNRPMNPKHIETFKAYSEAGYQRRDGARLASRYGAAGVIVRSLGFSNDPSPHTGAMNDTTEARVPAIAISPIDADKLSEELKKNPSLEFYYKTNCQTLPDAKSYNVIGEIKGSEFPDEIILVGGHLDSWDLAQGAHDDGAGCMQSIEVLRTFQKLGIKPKRTIRAVMFMNEENGTKGALKYAEEAKEKKLKHLAAIESDAGGFTPRGFGIDGAKEAMDKIASWKTLLDDYDLHELGPGGTGVDIGPLKAQGATLLGFRPDSQRYFDIHHSTADNFDRVSKRELELGAASMSALVYLIDKYGL
jgi:carboxypeptidase Q